MNNIKKIREEMGISQRELARKTGLSCGYICHLEKERRNNPSFNTMQKIASVLNRDISEVFK